MDSNAEVTVRILVSDAWLLAQLVKRITWYDIRDNAVDKDEARDMVDAIERFRTELARVGFAPR